MKELEPFRKEIDEIDDQIIALLGRRYEIVRQVGHFKAENGVKVVQSARAQEVLDRNAQAGEKVGLNPDLIRKLYSAMIDEAHVIEHAIVNSKR